MEKDFTFAVARIRSKELSLLNANDLDLLLNAGTTEECYTLLSDKGWDTEKISSYEELLSNEEKKTWRLIKELTGDDCNEFDVFFITNDFHNLKAAVKAVVTDTLPSNIFLENGKTDAQKIYQLVKNREYSSLPAYLQTCAKEAITTLLQTSDGQLCDIIIDTASLKKLRLLGKSAGNTAVKLYAETTVASANVKMAVRCAKTGKPLSFIKQCLVECGTLSASSLAIASTKGMDEIYQYLQTTAYKDGVAALKQSLSAFERWCDNMLIVNMKAQKWEPFTVGPLIAYALAREFELKAVRMILSAKVNELDLSIIKERLRDMYV